MAKLDIDIPHQLSQEEALQRVKTLLTKTREQHSDQVKDLKESWNGPTGDFSFSIMGFAVSGTLHVTASAIELRGQIPMALAFFKTKITNIIEEQAGGLFA